MNPTVDWLFFSDCGQLEDCPRNVRVIETDCGDYCTLIGKRLNIDFRPDHPYKLCDLKPALGYVHANQLADYDFWAFGDLDVVYGQLREYFTTTRLARYDLISTHTRRVSGHLTLVRNTPRMCEAFRLIPDWQRRFCGPHQALDEGAFSRIFIRRKNFEAMACGCVLCAYDQGEAENRALGFVDMENLVLYRDVDELQAKLRILRADSALADRIAATGQALVEREYTFDRIGARIVEALNPPLRPNPPPGPLERLKLALRL